MIIDPFPSLTRFWKDISIALCERQDNIRNDDDTIRALRSIHWPHTDALVSLKQTHGRRVVITRSPSQRIEEADSILTDQCGLTLTIRAADCQALIVYEPVRKIIGLIHAGWRGVDNGIIAECFRIMCDEWGIDPSDIFVAAGPSLCKACADFTDPKRELSHVPEALFDGRHVDLQAAADNQLMTIGVKPDHIERPFGCTRCHPEKWWTYRGGHRQDVTDGATNVLMCTLKQR